MAMPASTMYNGDVALFDKSKSAGNLPPGPAEIRAALDETGAAICRGYLPTVDEFIDFSDQFIREFVPYVGGANNGRAAISGKSSVYTVTEPSMKVPLPLHGEMYYLATPPDILWFYCICPANAAGETTLCDGRRILEELSSATRREFERRDVIYRRNFAEKTWKSVYQTDEIADVSAFCRANRLDLVAHPDGGISTTFRASAIARSPAGDAFVNSVLTFAAQEYLAGSNESQVRWATGEEIDRTMLMEIKTVSDRLTVAHAWRAGDAIFVDNRRTMHGRRAFSDDQRNIVVRLGMLA